MRQFRLTTEEFRHALERAARDDVRWPQLRSHKWLIDHAQVKDGEVILVTGCEHAPRPPLDRPLYRL
jgi:hypothetical protein